MSELVSIGMIIALGLLLLEALILTAYLCYCTGKNLFKRLSGL